MLLRKKPNLSPLKGRPFWSRFTDSLTTLAGAVVGLERELNETVEEVHSSAKIQDQRFAEVERSEQIIASRIGDEPMEFSGSTVWEGIATLSEQLKEGIDPSLFYSLKHRKRI